MKRTFLALSVLLTAALVLAACAPAAAPYECTDEIGCVTYAPDEPIRIASALVISGPNIDLGTDSQYGVEIAMDFKGEVLGHALELQAEDDGCSAEGGQTAGQKNRLRSHDPRCSWHKLLRCWRPHVEGHLRCRLRHGFTIQHSTFSD